MQALFPIIDRPGGSATLRPACAVFCLAYISIGGGLPIQYSITIFAVAG